MSRLWKERTRELTRQARQGRAVYTEGSPYANCSETRKSMTQLRKHKELFRTWVMGGYGEWVWRG